MKFLSLLATVAALVSTTLAHPAVKRQDDSTFSGVTIFTPPSNYTVPRTLYARTVLLKEGEEAGVILSTWENYLYKNNSFPYFPIYASTDGGKTWSERSRVEDQVNGWGLRYQPFLYELPEDFAGFAAGTILLSGSSIPDDLSQTQIEVYASTDKGYTWKFISHVALGGEALPNNDLTPVWEPFLLSLNNQLICYYSDQRDPAQGQKLVHQVTSDLLTWGPVVNDVAYSTYDWRPGMTTIAQLPNGKWIMTYEFLGAVEADFAVYYRISDDPLTFDAVQGYPIIATDGTVPVGSPYIVWTGAGGENGTLVVSCGTRSDIYLNRDLGAADAWVRVASPEGTSYTRSLMVMADEDYVLIAGGGVLNGDDNSVTASSVDVSGAL